MSDKRSLHAVTAANVNGLTAAKAMPIEEGASYVFDLGYYDYRLHGALPHGVLLERWRAKLNEAGCCIVTRLKSNTPLEIVEETLVPSAGAILSDRIGYVPARQAKS